MNNDKKSVLSPFECAEQGWYVFPCRGKRPLVPWRKDSTTDPDTIEAWMKKYPGCNFGVDCMKSGLFVLDIDSGKNLDAMRSLQSLVEKYGELPPTFTVRTPSGGFHQYFYGHGRNSAGNKLGPGLDTRGDGGFVILPCGGGYTIV